jgi:hypothetical protein
MTGIIRIFALVIALVMTLRDVIAKLWNGLKRLASHLGQSVEALWNATKNKWVDITTKMRDAFAKGNLKKAGEAFAVLGTMLPLIIAAVAGDDPDLGEVASAVQQLQPAVAKTVSESKKILDNSTDRATKDLPPDKQTAAIRAQIDTLRKQLDEVCKTAKTPFCNFPAEKAPVAVKVTAFQIPAKQAPTKQPAGPAKPPAGPAAPAKTGVGAALALAIPGFFVGGPVGAGIGFVVGLAAGGKKA